MSARLTRCRSPSQPWSCSSWHCSPPGSPHATPPASIPSKPCDTNNSAALLRISGDNRGMAPLAAIVVFAAFQTNFYQDGLKALDAKQYEAAAGDFTKALEADPK